MIKPKSLLSVICGLLICTYSQTIKDPIEVNNYITVMGSSFAYGKNIDVVLSVPDNAETGDLLVLFVGGSASGTKIPGWPSGDSWELILTEGPNDINLAAYYKEYDPSETEYTLSGGKNTFVTLTALRGIDNDDPIKDSDAEKDTMDGKNGEAKTPSIKTSNNGCVIGAFVFDDKHKATIINDGFSMMVSEKFAGDGMAVGVATTDGSESGEIETIGEGYEAGGGNEVAMAISFKRARYGGSTSSNSRAEENQKNSVNNSGNNDNNDDNNSIVIIIVCVVVASVLFLAVIGGWAYRNQKMRKQVQLANHDQERDYVQILLINIY